MNERIKKAYASAPKTRVWQRGGGFLVFFILLQISHNGLTPLEDK